MREWRQSCLQCVKSAKGDCIPRPLGTQLIPQFPGEILMLDFIEIGPSDDGFTYVLMAVGKYSKLVEFVPASVDTQKVVWSTQIADAVTYIHGQDLVHRDIKPDNVLVDVSGDIKMVRS